MSSHYRKSGKKDEQAGASLPETMADVAQLLDQHMEARAVDFRTSFNQLEKKFQQVCSVVDEHGQRLSLLKFASDDLNQRVSELENVCSGLREGNTKLAREGGGPRGSQQEAKHPHPGVGRVR